MKSLKSQNDIKVIIYERKEISEIPEKDWDALSLASIYNNPFFERWNLLPALTHMEISSSIYVICLYSEKSLVGLFPIKIEQSILGLSLLTIWDHDHSYLTDPLIKYSIDIPEVMDRIGRHFNIWFSQIHLHSPDLLSNVEQSNIFKDQSTRAYIKSTKTISPHLISLAGKTKRELQRLKRKINKKYKVEYKVHTNLDLGLESFSNIENSGWKGKDRGSIKSRINVYSYYKSMMSSGRKNIEFQELKADDEVIAISMRFKSQRKYYEVKTAYNEEFREFAPGKLLELYTLESLSKKSSISIDSCTGENNKFINNLWPEQLKLQSSYIFYDHPISQMLKMIYRFKKTITKPKWGLN